MAPVRLFTGPRIVAVCLAAMLTLTGCGLFGIGGDKFDQAFTGIAATMQTYDQFGNPVDRVHGTSFRVSRDTEFDTSNSDGTSKNDSSVLLISLGKSHISHVGSTLLLAEDGVNDVTAQLPATVDFENSERGTPWLNDIHYRFQQLWKGAAKTLMIRSQNGTPIKVYAGNEVQVLSTDVPKSTWFRIDGKTLLVYRADYTVVDNKLLSQ